MFSSRLSCVFWESIKGLITSYAHILDFCPGMMERRAPLYANSSTSDLLIERILG